MPPADTPAEVFKRALAHAARALAEQSELEVVFGSDGPQADRRRPDPAPSAAHAVRTATAPPCAARPTGWPCASPTTTPAIHATPAPRRQPRRRGVRGRRTGPRRGHRLDRPGRRPRQHERRPPDPSGEDGRPARHRGRPRARRPRPSPCWCASGVTGQRAPDGAGAMLDLVRTDIEAKAGVQLDTLAETAGDQAAFGKALKDVLRALDLDPGDGRGDDASEDQGDEEPDPQEPEAADDQDDEEDEGGGEGGQSMDGSSEDQTSERGPRRPPRRRARRARRRRRRRRPRRGRGRPAQPPGERRRRPRRSTPTASSPPPSTRSSTPPTCATRWSWSGCAPCWTSS